MSPNAQFNKSPSGSAAHWMLASGIQADNGGVCAWHNLKDGSNSYLYSEITGYAITTLLFLFRVCKDKIFLEKAKLAAGWIVDEALHSCGGVKTRLYKDEVTAEKDYSFLEERIFSFDTGMVLYGMVNLYKAAKDPKFLGISEKIAGFLSDKMLAKDGYLYPIYDAKTGKAISPEDKWSNRAGSFHAKVSLGFVELFKITGEKRYKEISIKLCEYAMSKQEDSGRFITDVLKKTTHVHPHCYSVEGLWYTGTNFDIPEFVNSGKKAVEWVFKNVSGNGINELYDPASGGFNDFQRSDILAQVLRLGVMYKIGSNMDELISVLSGYQYRCDSEQNGGFLYSRNDGHVNSWCSMFALQALYLASVKESKDIAKDYLI